MSDSRAKGSGLDWFVRRGGAVRGPFSSAKVRHYVLEGRLQLDDEVSTDRANWQRIGSVDEVVPRQMRNDDTAVAEAEQAQRRIDRWRALRAIVVVAVVVTALVIAVTLIGQPEGDSGPDCTAPPQPGVVWENCRLSGSDLTAADLSGARLANASLANARLSRASLDGADLRYVDLSGADLSYARLAEVNLKGANLRAADLTNADLRGADLRFADLSLARVGGVRFDQALLDGAIWVDGRKCAATDCPR